MRIKYLNFAVAFSVIALTGCNHINDTNADNFQSLTQQQQAQYWQARKVDHLTDKVKSLGVQIYAVGDDYQLIIPTNRIFVGNTPAYNSSAKAIFKAIANLINAQSTPSLRIEAYANNSASKDRNFALSQSWADTAKNQLRQADLDVGVVYTKAYGSCDNIGSDSLNNRLEIHYRVSHDD